MTQAIFDRRVQNESPKHLAIFSCVPRPAVMTGKQVGVALTGPRAHYLPHNYGGRRQAKLGRDTPPQNRRPCRRAIPGIPAQARARCIAIVAPT
eukprot:scaffold42728_cov27-Tisochrysis_lutea.AAC.6